MIEAATRTGGESGAFGERIMELADRLAQWSESTDGLTCTYLSPAHRAVAAEIGDLMRRAMDRTIASVFNALKAYCETKAASHA